jgi:hypothetical protein
MKHLNINDGGENAVKDAGPEKSHGRSRQGKVKSGDTPKSRKRVPEGGQGQDDQGREAKIKKVLARIKELEYLVERRFRRTSR